MNHPVNKTVRQALRRSWPNVLVILLFSAFITSRFWSALTGAVSLSKVQQLAEWDSLFAAQRTGQSMLMDPSLAYFMMPYYLLKATLIKSGQLPLWNPYSGLGCPLAADPESLAFSPLHLPLIFSPGFLAYHQILVLEIIILGVGTFALIRSLKIGMFASIVAMMAMAFCPYERWYLELLGNGFCFVPIVFWQILSLRTKVSAAKVWLAGFSCAMMVLTAHPELSFCSIALASLGLILYVLFDRTALIADGYPDNNKESFDNRLKHSALALISAGVIAFMLASPMLLPFIEYLRNCDSYKFGSGAPAIVRWQTLIFNLLQPGFGGASPTLGPCILLFVPLAFACAQNQRSMVRQIAGLTIFTLFLTGKAFPFNLILSHPPFSYLVVNYAFPAAILMTAVLAAYGLDTVLKAAQPANAIAAITDDKNSKQTIILPIGPVAACIAIAALVAAFPAAAKALHWPLVVANFDMCLPDYTFDKGDVVRYSVYAALAAAAVIAIKVRPAKWSALLLMGAVCLGQTAEITTSAKSMPKRPPFKYEETITIPELSTITEAGQDRFIATGNHLFRPNSNVVFALSDLRTHNAIYPKGYVGYMEACGAKLDGFNQVFESPLSPLLNLASVNAVLTQTPVLTSVELGAAKNNAAGVPEETSLCQPEPGIKAAFTPVLEDYPKRAIFGYLTLHAPLARARDLSYSLALYDENQDVQWISDSQPLEASLDQKIFEAIPMPVAEDQSGKGWKYLLAIQLYDRAANRWLSPGSDNGLGAKLKDVFILAQLAFAKNSDKKAKGQLNKQYKLVFQSPNRLRIYKNTDALPRAYVVHASSIVPNDIAALEAIKQSSFDPRQRVVIDSSTKNIPGDKNLSETAHTAPSAADANDDANADASREIVKVLSLTANQVSLKATLDQPGIVVLNDNYYPGWQASVDGHNSPIMRANYLMRAVEVPKGEHRIIFSYRPLSFTIGIILCIIALGAGIVAAAGSLRKRLQ